jgi:hypothetical protein
VASDSYLKLVPRGVADAILASNSDARHAFAVACANLAVDHCARAVLGLDDGADMTLSQMRDHALAAGQTRAPGEVGAIDRLLARREDHLYAQLCALRADDSDAPYNEYVRLAAQRHAVRALRAALAPDGIAAAASAAFETISVTRNEADIEALAQRTLPIA